jgi:hypothetical protein
MPTTISMAKMFAYKISPTMDQKLPYKFQEDSYWAAEPEEIELIANIVVACAENHLSPLAAAQKITDVLAIDAWSNKAIIDANDEDRPYNTNYGLVAVLIGSCMSSFPPHSVVHKRLFQMIKSFMRAVRREVPNALLDRAGKVRFGYATEDMRPAVPMWESLTPLSFSSSCEWLADIGFPWTGVEKIGSQEQQRWRNYSHFSARLAVEGIERMGWQTALQRLLPKYGMPDEKTIGWSGYQAGQVLAAAQWFVPDEHGLWVWRTCCYCQRHNDKIRPDLDGGQASNNDQGQDGLKGGKNQENNRIVGWSEEALEDLVNLEGWLWNLENWKVWKAAFKEITKWVDDVRVHEVVRREASKALKVMEDLETS